MLDQWKDSELQTEVEVMEDGTMSLRGTCRYFNIPFSFLSYHLHGRTIQRKRGVKGVHTTSKDEEIV